MANTINVFYKITDRIEWTNSIGLPERGQILGILEEENKLEIISDKKEYVVFLLPKIVH